MHAAGTLDSAAATQAHLQAYEQRLAWLWSLIQAPARISGSRPAPSREVEAPGLYIRRLRSFLDFAGAPHTRFAPVHVAGTSGKGSVTTLLARILTAAGYRTGWHISPYLQLPHEKLIVGDRWISVPAFNELLAGFARDYSRWQRAQSEYARLRYGEAWVALTFMFMARQQVDWGIVECGLGGRWDPTNVVQPALSLITNVGLDHLESLGGTLESIAWHKAGILKPDSLALTGVTQPRLLALLRTEATRRYIPLHTVGPMAAEGKTFRYAAARRADGMLELTVQSRFARHARLCMREQASFQVANAALAVAAADLLQAAGRVQVPEEALAAGLREGSVPGRMEVMQEEPKVILDCAHNLPKMQSLAAALRAAWPDREFHIVAGMLRTKDAAGMLSVLANLPGDFRLCQPHVFGKTSHAPGDLARALPTRHQGRIVGLYCDVAHALAHALAAARPGWIILVTGSVYLVGEARDHWYPRTQMLQALARDSRPLASPWPAPPGQARDAGAIPPTGQ